MVAQFEADASKEKCSGDREKGQRLFEEKVVEGISVRLAVMLLVFDFYFDRAACERQLVE